MEELNETKETNIAQKVVDKNETKEVSIKTKTGLTIATSITFVLATVAGAIWAMLLLLPILAGVLYVVFCLVIFVITVCTLGLLWTNEGNRIKVGEVDAWIKRCIDGTSEILVALPYVAGVAGALLVASLVLSIIGVCKKSKGCIPFLCVTGALIVLCATLMIVQYCK